MAARKGERRPSSPAPGPDGESVPSRPPTQNAESIIRFRSQDGLLLAVRVFGEERSSRLPLVCLPGLSRNSRDFATLGRYFARHPTEPRRIFALDYRGRGLSESDPNWRNYKPLVEAQDVIAAFAALGIEQAIVVGTSRGGIIAMLLGALRPTLLAGVVFNDIGPIIEGTGLARIKQYLGARRGVGSWGEAIAAARSIGEGQFPALSDDDWRASAEAYFSADGHGLAPQFDPNLARAIGDIDFSERVPVLWPQFMSLANVPAMAIRGEFSDVLSSKTLGLMAERHPRLEQVIVPGQGHAPVLRDDSTLGRILAFARHCHRH